MLGPQNVSSIGRVYLLCSLLGVSITGGCSVTLGATVHFWAILESQDTSCKTTQGAQRPHAVIVAYRQHPSNTACHSVNTM